MKGEKKLESVERPARLKVAKARPNLSLACWHVLSNAYIGRASLYFSTAILVHQFSIVSENQLTEQVTFFCDNE